MAQFNHILELFGRFSLDAQTSPDIVACDLLASKIHGATIHPTDVRYNASTTENWSQTAWESPTCIFQPNTVQELQTAVPILVDSNASFAIRSGGHMPVPHAASIDAGVLIDMSSIGGTQYDVEKNVVVIGAGQKWGDVYPELDQYEVTVAGGRVLSPGVGGLILGCGISYLSDLYGLVCDNVLNYEVVLADGSLVNANKESNADLYWALKGGSNNFGIVTAFTLQAYPIFHIWGGTKVYPFEALSDVLDALAEFQTDPNKDPYAQFNINAYVTNTTFGIVIGLTYLKPEEAPAAFAPFFRLDENWNTILDTTGLRTIHNLISEYPIPSIPRVEWTTTSFQPTQSLYKSIREIFATSPAVDELRGLTAGTGIFTLQGISASAVEAGKLHGGNALGLEPVAQTWFHTDIGWWFPEDDEIAHNGIRSLTDEVEALAKAQGKYLRYIFMNDASIDQQVIEHYGEDNVRKLREVQQKYDPGAVFQRLVPGGFKLPHLS
ncbi:putative FAD-binding oxidoreductase [Daldinia decipiens]|uniref:putative FAD-binding oxidoreductase n=1 Tax=Daldinia decipiens TaxID=326647 RepID=UPI0020C1E5C7|nr:putative FAD-binding oxidoreductase [Daldinia decipiens]KAI1656816.1 putative FAD-binding oxidoreductase [Daldinia decipiens]